MKKKDELADPDSCLNRAKDDEIIFVILARDVAAPHAVIEWALERCRRGKNRLIDTKIIEALECAVAMEKQRQSQEMGLRDYNKKFHERNQNHGSLSSESQTTR